MTDSTQQERLKELLEEVLKAEIKLEDLANLIHQLRQRIEHFITDEEEPDSPVVQPIPWPGRSKSLKSIRKPKLLDILRKLTDQDVTSMFDDLQTSAHTVMLTLIDSHPELQLESHAWNDLSTDLKDAAIQQLETRVKEIQPAQDHWIAAYMLNEQCKKWTKLVSLASGDPQDDTRGFSPELGDPEIYSLHNIKKQVGPSDKRGKGKQLALSDKRGKGKQVEEPGSPVYVTPPTVLESSTSVQEAPQGMEIHPTSSIGSSVRTLKRGRVEAEDESEDQTTDDKRQKT